MYGRGARQVSGSSVRGGLRVLLYHLTRNENRVLTFRTLLAKVWGREYMDETDYLKVHIQHLRRKLGDDPQNDPMIMNERGVGYKFVRRERRIASSGR